jgi:hypothetical protein
MFVTRRAPTNAGARLTERIVRYALVTFVTSAACGPF